MIINKSLTGIQKIYEKILSFKLDNQTKENTTSFKENILRPYKDLVYLNIFY